MLRPRRHDLSSTPHRLQVIGTLFEACVDSLAQTRDAASFGADRVELCIDLAHDGCTPPLPLAAECSAVGIPVIAMVRPRPGNFTYSRAEIDAMCGVMLDLADRGVSGFATGALLGDGGLDVAAIEQLVRTAGALPVTVHRAFDHLGNLDAGLDLLIELGVRRVLTSGGQPSALMGVDALRRLTDRAAGRIEVIAAGTIRPFNVDRIVAATNAPAVHARWCGWQEGLTSTTRSGP